MTRDTTTYYDTLVYTLGMLQALADEADAGPERRAYLAALGYITDGVMKDSPEARKTIFDAKKLQQAVEHGHQVLGRRFLVANEG